MTNWPLDWRELLDEAVRRRRQEGLTQRSLAALAGVSPPTVNAFERGETRLQLEKVIAILDTLGMILLPGPVDSFQGFVQGARRRWAELVAPLPEDHPSCQPLGHVEHCYHIEGLEFEGSLASLRDTLAGLPKTSGWTPFWVPTREAIRPAIRDGLVECWLGKPDIERTFADAAHSDYWQVNAELMAYLQRGYQEDGPDTLQPGTIFDLTLPIWRTAEVLLHASHLIESLGGTADNNIVYSARYTGLGGRELAAWTTPRNRFDLLDHHLARTERMDLSVRTTPARIMNALEQDILTCLAPLYDQFDGYELSSELVRAQIAELRRARLGR